MVFFKLYALNLILVRGSLRVPLIIVSTMNLMYAIQAGTRSKELSTFSRQGEYQTNTSQFRRSLLQLW